VKTLIDSFVRRAGERAGVPFAVRFPGGGEYRNREGAPAFTVVIRSAAAFPRIAAFGHVGLLESYFDGQLDIEGSLPAMMAVGMESGVAGNNLPVDVRNRWHEFRFSNRDWAQAKRNAEFHYALGTEFYRYWLDDPHMMYTCAYWKEGTRSLEQAQQNKIEHVAQKVRLAPGETVVDIGSGFGGFMFHAHDRFGVKVTGINNTTSQVEMVRAEIARRGLAHSLEVIDTDFRDARRQYDKVVSIGTLEHAGRDSLEEVVRAHAAFLKPGGLGMLHFIGHVGHFQTDFFIRRHVFPGGWIPSLAHTIAAMERAGLEVVDIENLRRHYALTLDAWGERFDANWERIRQLDPAKFDERFRRVWRAYLYGCAEMFRSAAGYTHLFQIVFSKGNVTRQSYPMSRAFLYEPPAHRQDAGAQRAA
jgi:cyclopropane-fatty-acyl-phospholipid synthase